MRRARVIIGLVLIVVLAISVAGCSGKAKNTGKNIIMARPADSDNLDPVLQDGNINIWVFNLVMESIIKTSDDGTQNDVPSLATDWKFSTDQKSITFTLRKGVKFSDGTAMTADDVVWSLNRASQTKESPWQFALAEVKNVEKVDADHVKVNLNKPWAPIMAGLSMFNAVISSKAYFDKVGKDGFSQKPLGTGPFYFAEWKKGEYILLKRNPYYWDKGKPLVDSIKITVVPDDNTRIMQLQSGAVDMVENIPFSRVTDIQKDPNLNMILAPSTLTYYVGFNLTKKPFDNLKVRQALAYGTDKNALIKTVLFGNGTIATSFFPKGTPMFDTSIKSLPYDPEKAKQLLKDAGVAAGTKLEIAVIANNLNYNQMATVLKDQWARIGIDLQIKQMDMASMRAYYKALNQQIIFGGWTNDVADASEISAYMTYPEAAKDFWTGWPQAAPADAKKAEDLARAAEAEMDKAKRADLYKQLQQYIDQQMPRIPLYYVPYTFATRKNITGFVQTPLGNYRFENLDKVSGK